MNAMTFHAPGGFDRLELQDRADTGQPGPGEIRLALHGSTLNFHDLGIATGRMPSADGRVPLADGAGEIGVNHVVEVGGPGTLAQSIEAVRVGGHISLIGALTGASGQVSMAKQARLQGLIIGSRRKQQDVTRALDGSGVKPPIERCFPLDRLADAFRFEMGVTHLGKIGVEW